MKKTKNILNERKGTGQSADARLPKHGGYSVEVEKIVCGECGKKYWHKAKPKGGVVWKCSTLENEGRKTTKRQNHKDLGLRNPDKGCDSTNLNQEEIDEILEAVGNELSINRSKVKADMLSWLNNLLATLTNSKERVSEKAKYKNLLKSIMDGVISSDMAKETATELEARIKRLETKQQLVSGQGEEARDMQRIINNIDKELDSYIGDTNLQQERTKFVLNNLTSITVYSDKVEINIRFMPRPIGVRRGIRKNIQYVDGDNNEQSRLFIADSIKRHLVISHQFTKFLNIEHREPCAA